MNALCFECDRSGRNGLSTQLYFQDDLTHVRSWFINGKHYSQTSEHWLKAQDANAKAGLAELEKDALAKGLDKEEGRKAFYRFVLQDVSLPPPLLM